jgi:hypothetical protein
VVVNIVRSIVGIGGKIGAIVMKEVRALLSLCVVSLLFDRMIDCGEMNASVVGQIPVRCRSRVPHFRIIPFEPNHPFYIIVYNCQDHWDRPMDGTCVGLCALCGPNYDLKYVRSD